MVSTLIAQDVPTANSVTGFSPKPDFAEVYQDYWQRILRYLLVKTEDYHLAEDLTSQVFVRAFRKYDSFEMRSRPELSAWLFRIARNVFISSKRHEKGANFVDFEEATLYVSDGFEEGVSRKLELAQLRQETRNLPEGQQLVIALTTFFDFAPSGIARIIGISDSNVKVRKHKAKGNLKKLFFGSNHDNGGGRNRSLTVAEIIEVTSSVLEVGLPTTPLKVIDALKLTGYTKSKYYFTQSRYRRSQLLKGVVVRQPLIPSQVLTLKVARVLEDRGYGIRRILKAWRSLPEDFFERLIKEVPHIPILQVPEEFCAEVKPTRRKKRRGSASVFESVEQVVFIRQLGGS